LAARAWTAAVPQPAVAPAEAPPRASSVDAFRSTVIQTAWLAVSHVIASAVVFAAAWIALPWLVARTGLTLAVALAPLAGLAGMALYAPATLALAVAVKRLVIGRYRPMTAPVWGAFYLRHWIVVAVARMVPWRVLQGTVFHAMALRALGARIGRRVHIHRVDLTHGGWDLLDIGDDAVIGQDATLGLVELEDGHVVVGPVTIGAGALVDVRAGVDGHGVVGAGAELTALSSLPEGGRIPDGARWDGIPARPSTPAVDHAGDLGEVTHGFVVLVAESAVTWLRWAPLSIGAVLWMWLAGLDAGAAAAWILAPSADWRAIAPLVALTVIAVPVTLAGEALLLRALGPARPGAISAWGWGAVRVWIKTGVLQSAGNWLSGTLFWPVWLRAAGMRLGTGCEISTIIDVVPELVTFGPDVFLADGIYLAGPVRRGRTITLAHTTLGARTFLGNHVVIPIGITLPDDVLIGVSTVADPSRIRSGSSWFGLPPFELPRREVVDVDRSLTHEPSAVRYWNRVFWEALRVALPVPPALVALWWSRAMGAGAASSDPWRMAFVVSPVVTFVAVAALVVLVLALKWALIWRVRPGQHPLWSCWCSRWDFLYVAWNRYASPALGALEGTLLLPWYLRAMGMRIGRGVVLGPGFAQVVDPDMLTIDDGATVHAMFQAHTFEDRVLKIDHVRIRRGATVGHGTVVLYGADIGEDTHVAPHSVVMKRETLLPARHYAGAPVKTTSGVVF
jgi:non-ribosomal peptide synthetase-like protein